MTTDGKVVMAQGIVKGLSPTNNSFMINDMWITLSEGKVMDKVKKDDNVSVLYRDNGVSKVCAEVTVRNPTTTTNTTTSSPQNWAKNMVKFKDLLSNAHDLGLHSIKTTMIQIDIDKGYALFKAEVWILRNNTVSGPFEAHGDATDKNIDNMLIKKHFIRMAETRAIARALRLATNNGEVAEEEVS